MPLVVGGCGQAPSSPSALTAAPPEATQAPAITPRPTITRLPIEYGPGTPPATTAAESPAASDPTAYLQTRSAQYDAAAKAVGSVEQKMAQAVRNPSVLQDADWRTATSRDAAAMKAAGQQFVQTTTIPADLAELNSWFVNSGGEMVGAADDVIQALSANDLERIQHASSRLMKTDVNLQHVNQFLSEAKKKYGLTP